MPGTSKISTTVGVRMPHEVHAELIKYAAAERRTVSWVIKDFVEQGLRRAALPNAPGASAKRVSKRPRKQRLEA
jgi:hypothetical protein